MLDRNGSNCQKITDKSVKSRLKHFSFHLPTMKLVLGNPSFVGGFNDFALLHLKSKSFGFVVRFLYFLSEGGCCCLPCPYLCSARNWYRSRMALLGCNLFSGISAGMIVGSGGSGWCRSAGRCSWSSCICRACSHNWDTRRILESRRAMILLFIASCFSRIWWS